MSALRLLLRNFVVLGFLGVTVAGCARFHQARDVPLGPSGAQQLRQLSGNGLTDKAEVLYLLMTAEIAGQQQNYALALENYMKAAEKIPDPWVAERAARIAFYLKDAESADRAVTLWLDRAPHSLGARKAALMLALQEGKKASAIEHFSQLLESAGDDRSEVLLEILRFVDQSVPKELALDVVAAVSERYPQSPEILYAYAMLALRQGQTELALEQVSKAAELRPDWPKLRLMQSQLLVHLGEESKAQQILKDLVEKHPQDVQLRLLYARLLLKQRAFDEALEALDRILRQEPDNPDALYAHALVNLQQGRDQMAERSLKRLTQQPKWRDEAYFYLGRIALRRGRYEEALSRFDRIEEGELVFDARVNAVALLTQLGRPEEALQQLDGLRDRFPERKLQLYLLEAEIQANQANYQAAFTTLTHGLGDFPGHPDLLYARALLAERMGQADSAIADLRAAIAKRPDDPNLLNALGYTLLEYTGQIQQAREYLEQAIQLAPDNPAILDSYGWLWYKLEDYAKAVEYLKRAYEEHPDPEIATHLGEAYWALGQKAEARRLWREIIRQAPKEDGRIQSLIERFRDRLEP